MLKNVVNSIARIKEARLVNEIRRINVIRVEPIAKLIIQHPPDLPMIRHDKSSVMYQIDAVRCVKVYRKRGKAEKEYEFLLAGAMSGVTPQAYGCGPSYVVMEMIHAPTVSEYLTEHPLTAELSDKLLRLLDTLEKIGFQADHSPQNIFLMADGNLKAVDVSDKKQLQYTFPNKMIKGLGIHVFDFLEYVKEENSSLYDQWTEHPEFARAVTKAMNQSAKYGDLI